MKLHTLPKSVDRSKKRQGQGRGSGKGGHTAGRGQKGQKSRGSIALVFEGTKIKKSLLKRLPLWRGKGKMKARGTRPVIVNLKYLNIIPEGSQVDLELLIKLGIVNDKAKISGVKILGDGKLEKKSLIVKLPVSNGARKQIENLQGKVLADSLPESHNSDKDEINPRNKNGKASLQSPGKTDESMLEKQKKSV